MTKKQIIISAIIITIVVSILLLLLNKNIKQFLILAGFVLFLLFALLEPPKKHKEHTLNDFKKATCHALGGAGPPEIEKPTTNKKKQKKNIKNV